MNCKKCDEENLGLNFEFIVPGTPQQNSVVERNFPTIMQRGRAMMNYAGYDENYRRKLWCETILIATKLDSLMVIKMGESHLTLISSTNIPDTGKNSEPLVKWQ